MVKLALSHRKTVLSNGLRVLTIPLKTTGAVTVLVLVGAGSRYENPENNGVAHFLEHIFFKGGKKYRNTREVSEALDAVGADFNAFTASEYAGYYVRVIADKAQLAFDVLSDMLLSARLPQEEIEKERKVILEEYRMVNDTPIRKIGDLFESLIFAGSPMGLPTIGDPQTIKKLSKKDFVYYRQKLYVPDNIVVAVAGDITHQEACSLSKRYFRFPHGTKSLFSRLTLTPEGVGLKLLPKKTEQAHLIIGVPTFGAEDPRRYALKVLSTVLGEGMSSRMFLLIREKHGLAYYIHTGDELYTDAGYLATSAGVDLRRVQAALKLILGEYERVTRSLVGPHELKKAKERIKGSMVLNLEGPSNVAGYFSLQELLLNKTESPSQRLKKIDQVSADDVKQVAKEIFQGGRFQLAIIGPYRQRRMFLNLLNHARKEFSAD